MRHQVIIRQERPIFTREPYRKRTWELFVKNRLTGVYEYYSFTWSFAEAIVLADIVWTRSNNVPLLEIKEATC